MELRQLEYLVAVADEAGFTRAAERLHVAQPGVSAQVRKLEVELGEPLLDRSGGTVKPTAVGETVLVHARDALAAVQRVRSAVDEHAGLLRGRVAVGTIASGSPPELSDLLAAFARDHPAVELSLVEAGSEALLAGLRDGRFDLTVAGLGTDAPDDLGTLVLREEPLVAAVSADDPLAGRREVRLDALIERRLACLPPGAAIRAALDDACDAAGLRPLVAYEVGTPIRLAELAARGLAVAVLPASAAAVDPTLTAVAIVAPRLRGSVVLAWPARRPASPAGRAFVAHVRAGLEAVAVPE